MRRLLLIPILVAFAALLAGAHVYLLRRLVLEPGVGEPWRSALVAVVCVLGAGIVAQPLAERWLPPARLRPLAWAASVWMGLAYLLLVQLLASDALLWALGGVAQAAAIGDVPETTAGLRASGVALLTLGAGIAALRSALRPPRLARVEIELPRWPLALDGYRIAQISDVHIGPLLDRRFARHVTERVNALDADLVAVAERAEVAARGVDDVEAVGAGLEVAGLEAVLAEEGAPRALHVLVVVAVPDDLQGVDVVERDFELDRDLGDFHAALRTVQL